MNDVWVIVWKVKGGVQVHWEAFPTLKAAEKYAAEEHPLLQRDITCVDLWRITPC